jgi:hypothetical protein
VRFLREEFPQKVKDMDVAVFADSHIKGYSVTAEVFANMPDAKPIAYAAWDQILTLGQAPMEQTEAVCRQIQRRSGGVEDRGRSQESLALA